MDGTDTDKNAPSVADEKEGGNDAKDRVVGTTLIIDEFSTCGWRPLLFGLKAIIYPRKPSSEASDIPPAYLSLCKAVAAVMNKSKSATARDRVREPGRRSSSTGIPTFRVAIFLPWAKDIASNAENENSLFFRSMNDGEEGEFLKSGNGQNKLFQCMRDILEECGVAIRIFASVPDGDAPSISVTGLKNVERGADCEKNPNEARVNIDLFFHNDLATILTMDRFFSRPPRVYSGQKWNPPTAFDWKNTTVCILPVLASAEPTILASARKMSGISDVIIFIHTKFECRRDLFSEIVLTCFMDSWIEFKKNLSDTPPRTGGIHFLDDDGYPFFDDDGYQRPASWNIASESSFEFKGPGSEKREIAIHHTKRRICVKMLSFGILGRSGSPDWFLRHLAFFSDEHRKILLKISSWNDMMVASKSTTETPAQIPQNRSCKAMFFSATTVALASKDPTYRLAREDSVFWKEAKKISSKNDKENRLPTASRPCYSCLCFLPALIRRMIGKEGRTFIWDTINVLLMTMIWYSIFQTAIGNVGTYNWFVSFWQRVFIGLAASIRAISFARMFHRQWPYRKYSYAHYLPLSYLIILVITPIYELVRILIQLLLFCPVFFQAEEEGDSEGDRIQNPKGTPTPPSTRGRMILNDTEPPVDFQIRT